MVKPAVVWTKTAVKQRREIFRYWNTRNGSTNYSKNLLKQIQQRIHTLILHPDSSVLTSFPDTRMAALGHFSLFYKQTAHQKIIITAFWDNRQDPEQLKTWLQQSS